MDQDDKRTYFYTTLDTIDDQKFQSSDHIVWIDAELESLIPDFMAQTRDDLIKMDLALKQQDIESLRRLGHSLKGSALMYEFALLGKLGMAIEEAAKKKNLIEIRGLLVKLKHYLADIQIEYK